MLVGIYLTISHLTGNILVGLIYKSIHLDWFILSLGNPIRSMPPENRSTRGFRCLPIHMGLCFLSPALSSTSTSSVRSSRFQLVIGNRHTYYFEHSLYIFIGILLIDWGKNCSVTSRRPIQLLMCFQAFSHPYSTQHTFQATGCFSTWTVSPLVEDEWRWSQWLLSNVGKNVSWAWVWTHNPWTDSPRRYQLSYRGWATGIPRRMLNWHIGFSGNHKTSWSKTSNSDFNLKATLLKTPSTLFSWQR